MPRGQAREGGRSREGGEEEMLTVNFTVEKLIGKRTEPREAARVPGWETETQKRNQFFRVH